MSGRPDRRVGWELEHYGPAGIIKAITHWFYPGDTGGQEFVY